MPAWVSFHHWPSPAILSGNSLCDWTQWNMVLLGYLLPPRYLPDAPPQPFHIGSLPSHYFSSYNGVSATAVHLHCTVTTYAPPPLNLWIQYGRAGQPSSGWRWEWWHHCTCFSVVSQPLSRESFWGYCCQHTLLRWLMPPHC
jgi:hypothetical protein